MAVLEAIDSQTPQPRRSLGAENERLLARVRELEHQLHLERSRNAGLERGLSALSERVVAMRKEAVDEPHRA
jgi:hypothetical protein